MSVNFYAFGPFPRGEAEGEGLHIGQRAQGYRFLMRSHPELSLTTLANWMQFLRRDDVTIRSEGGREYAPETLEALIRNARTEKGLRARARRVLHLDPKHHIDPEGVEFYAGEFC